jgi:lysophospholipid acyltransferase (LPLAT)-like uncharacterized protein
MKQRFLGLLVWIVYRLLSMTWRLVLVEPPSLKKNFQDQRTVLLAHWHGDELALLQIIGQYRIATIASTSTDGEIMNTALRLFGALTSRGSSTRGGASALRALIRLLKTNRRNSSFAVDGPRGPIHQVKPGVFEVSRLMQVPIYPGGVACDRMWSFPKSWNKTYLPKPFARVVIFWGDELAPVCPDEDPRSPKLSERLENALHYAASLAQKQLAGQNGE